MSRSRGVALFAFLVGVIATGSLNYGQQPQAGAAQAPRGGAGRGGGAAGRGGFGFGRALPPLPVPDSDFIKWVLTPEQRQYAKLDGNHMKSMLKEIVAFSEKSRADGNQNWGRHAGTIYDKMTRDYVVAQFKRIGLEDVRDQPVTQAPRWWPNSWEASLVVNGKTTPLKTVFALGGDSTPAAGVDLPIVYVGLGTAADFVGRDVRGKAVLIHAMPTPSRRENSAIWLGSAERAKQLGARMVIVNLAFPGMPDLVSKPGTGGGEDDVATSLTISLGPGESDMVRDLIGQGQTPMIHYRQEIVQKGGPSGVVIAKLSGMTDEWIEIEAHADGDFYGAMDNASGMSQLLGLAEYYAAIPKSQRRRNILFVVNSDHHSGSAGLEWVRTNMAAQIDKMVVSFNCEHPAEMQTYWISGGMQSSDIASARRINLGGTNGTPALRALVRQGFKNFGVATYTRPDGGDGSNGDGFSTAPPRIGVIDHTFYHSTADTVDFVPAVGIQQATQAYAYILDQINKMDMSQVRLPKKATQQTTTRGQ